MPYFYQNHKSLHLPSVGKLTITSLPLTWLWHWRLLQKCYIYIYKTLLTKKLIRAYQWLHFFFLSPHVRKKRMYWNKPETALKVAVMENYLTYSHQSDWRIQQHCKRATSIWKSVKFFFLYRSSQTQTQTISK